MVVCPCGVMVPSPGGGRARRGPRTPSCFDTSETVTSQPKDMEEPASVEKLTAANNNEQAAGIPRPPSRNSKNKGASSKSSEEARMDHASRTTLALATTESGRYVGTRPLRSNRSPTPTLHRIPLKGAADQKQAGNGRPSKHLPAVRTSPASPQDPQAAPAHLRDLNRAKVPLAVPRKSTLNQRLNELNVSNQRRLLKQDLSPQEKQLRSARPQSPRLARHTSPLYQNIVPSTSTTSQSQEIIYENLKPYARTGAKGTPEGVSMFTHPATPEPHCESEGSTVWLSESWKYNTIKKAPDFNIFEISDAESNTSRASSASSGRSKGRRTDISEASDAASSTSRGSSPSPRRDKEKKTLRSRLPTFMREKSGRKKEGDASPGQAGRHVPRGDRRRAHQPQGSGGPAGVHEVKATRAGEKDAINPAEHKGSRASAGLFGNVPADKATCQSGGDSGGTRASRRLSKTLSHNTVSDSSDNENRSLRRGIPRGVRPPPGGDAAHHGGRDASGKLMRNVAQSTPSDSSDYDSISTGSSWQDLTQDLISDSSDGEGGIWLSRWVQEARSRARASLGSEEGVWAGAAGWGRHASRGCSQASPLISPAASLRSLQPGRSDGGDPPPTPRAPLTPPATLRKLRKPQGCPGGLTAGLWKNDVSSSLKRASQALRGKEGGEARWPGHAHSNNPNNHAHPTAHNNPSPFNPTHYSSSAHSSAYPVSPAHSVRHCSPAHPPITAKATRPTTTTPAHTTITTTPAYTPTTNTTSTANTPTTSSTAHTPSTISPAHSDSRGVGASITGAAQHHSHPQNPSRSLPQRAGLNTLPRPHARSAATAEPLTSFKREGSSSPRREAPHPLQAPGSATWRPLSQIIPAPSSTAGEAAAWRRAPSPVLPPLPLGLLQDPPQRPRSPASPESGVDLASVCILSLDLTVDCGQEGDATFTIGGVSEVKETEDDLPQDETEAAGGPVQASLGRGREDTVAGGCLTTSSSSSVLFDEKYYEKDDFEPCHDGGGEGHAVPEDTDDNLVLSLDLQKEGGVPKLADTTVTEEDDFIEIDCDVQPMETLKRPLVYGYGCSPGGRLLRGSALGEKRLSRASIASDYVEMDLVEAILNVAAGKDSRTSGSCLDLKETYWDHWTARREASAGEMLHDGRSQDVKLPGCPSSKFCYDPEVLLAQVRCPKSLEDATFKQYSSCVKSHIYDHFEAVQEGLREYGLTHEPPDFMCSQPDLPGQPREAGVWPLDYSSEPELCMSGEPLPPAQRPPHVRNRDSSVDSGTWSYMPGSEDSTAVPSPRTCIPPVPFPRSSSSLSHVAATAGAYDPWLHLLPDVTPPRTPRNSFFSATAPSVVSPRPASPSPSRCSRTSTTSETRPSRYTGSPAPPPPASRPPQASKRSFLPGLSMMRSPLKKQNKDKSTEVTGGGGGGEGRGGGGGGGAPVPPSAPHLSIQNRRLTNVSAMSSSSSKSSSSSSSSSSASSKDSVATVIQVQPNPRSRGAKWLMKHFGGAKNKLAAV